MKVYSGRTKKIDSRASRPPEAGGTRLRIGKAVLGAVAFLLIGRLFELQIVDARFYRELGAEQREIFRELFPERGEILMQDGKSENLTPLATNKDVYLVYADPRLVVDADGVARKLAPLLGITPSRHSEHIEESRANARRPTSVGDPFDKLRAGSSAMPQDDTQGKDNYAVLLDRLSKRDDPYEPLKHGVEETVVEKIKKLGLAGIDSVREPVRYYPLKNISAQVAGFVGSDGEKIAGRYGLEGAFDSELAGKPGFFSGEKDVAGRWIPVGRRTLEPAVDGSTLVLTLDRAIQYFACTKLNEAVTKHGSSGGTVIIMEIKTGAIKAMCGSPDFDPNDYSAVKDISVFNNPATFGQYEPGSVFKVITMAAALDTGEVTPETTYEDQGEVRIGPYTINNSDYKTHGLQTMTQVLAESLNTGAIFAVRKVGSQRFADYVERFGFGKPTNVGFQKEASGDVAALEKRGEIYSATGSFGQGIAVTPIQLVAAVGAIANQGKLMAPYIVDEIRKSNGAAVKTEPKIIRETITARTAALLGGMMVSVVEKGHGKRAGVKGYFVAGKTGTAQIPRQDAKGYEPGATIGTFVGFAPVEDPRFVMLTRIDRPRDVQFAESSAAPLFGEIAKFLLNYWEVKPTRPQAAKSQ